MNNFWKTENWVVLPPVQHALVAVQLVCNGGAIYFHAGSEHDKLKPLGYLSNNSLYCTEKTITWLAKFFTWKTHHREEEIHMGPLVHKEPHWVAVYGHLAIDIKCKE